MGYLFICYTKVALKTYKLSYGIVRCFAWQLLKKVRRKLKMYLLGHYQSRTSWRRSGVLVILAPSTQMSEIIYLFVYLLT